MHLTGTKSKNIGRLDALAQSLMDRFGTDLEEHYVTKGYGNGMSGGFAYQFDPERRLPDMISHDSVFMGTLMVAFAQPFCRIMCRKEPLLAFLCLCGCLTHGAGR